MKGFISSYSILFSSRKLPICSNKLWFIKSVIGKFHAKMFKHFQGRNFQKKKKKPKVRKSIKRNIEICTLYLKEVLQDLRRHD